MSCWLQISMTSNFGLGHGPMLDPYRRMNLILGIRAAAWRLRIGLSSGCRIRSQIRPTGAWVMKSIMHRIAFLPNFAFGSARPVWHRPESLAGATTPLDEWMPCRCCIRERPCFRRADRAISQRREVSTPSCMAHITPGRVLCRVPLYIADTMPEREKYNPGADRRSWRAGHRGGPSRKPFRCRSAGALCRCSPNFAIF